MVSQNSPVADVWPGTLTCGEEKVALPRLRRLGLLLADPPRRLRLVVKMGGVMLMRPQKT